MRLPGDGAFARANEFKNGSGLSIWTEMRRQRKLKRQAEMDADTRLLHRTAAAATAPIAYASRTYERGTHRRAATVSVRGGTRTCVSRVGAHVAYARRAAQTNNL